MARLSTIDDILQWVKIDLGVPAICLELPNVTIIQTIEDAIQYYQKHSYYEGAYEAYIPIPITSGVSSYDTSGLDISSVVGLSRIITGSGNGLTTLFSSQLNLMGSEWVTGLGGETGQGLTMANYEMAMETMDMIDLYFQKTFRCIFRTDAEILELIPDPTENGVALIHVYKKESAKYIYNQELFKEYVRALVMIRWGFVLNKKTITLPGGGTVNGEWIYNEGKELRAECRQRIFDEQMPVMPQIG